MAPAAHSKLGASSSDRWMNCPGSVRLSDGIPNEGSFYARQGTAAHALGEMCLRAGKDASDYLGQMLPVGGDQFEVDLDMVEAVQTYLDLARDIVKSGDEVEYEARFDLSHLYPGMFGTADLSVYKEKQQRLVIVDYKHGQGVAVEVKDNPQLKYYALGSAMRSHNRPLKEIEVIVVQPRCPHADGPVRRWTYSAMELLDWSADLVEAAERTANPDAPLNPGEWCKFCPAAAVCPALRDHALKSAMADFAPTGEVVLSEPDTFNADTLAKVLHEVDVIEDWCRRVREHAHHEAEAGRIPPGFKLVPKRAVRRWKDEQQATAFLMAMGLTDEQLFKPKTLKSPAQVETAIGKKNKSIISAHVEAISSGTVLAPLSDPRPAARPEAQSEFSATE
jgi:Protein of unknown function (DUF2800)